jgi:hypothetical protein
VFITDVGLQTANGCGLGQAHRHSIDQAGRAQGAPAALDAGDLTTKSPIPVRPKSVATPAKPEGVRCNSPRVVDCSGNPANCAPTRPGHGRDRVVDPSFLGVLAFFPEYLTTRSCVSIGGPAAPDAGRDES